ncbi:probable 2-ketogluconate reductase [Sycon ciliatum]|uniref:probable 2-ketogluconate reductase n=1 Tax=Sycon ciliatum TaxID=27933 RepID=UPI0031F6A2D8
MAKRTVLQCGPGPLHGDYLQAQFEERYEVVGDDALGDPNVLQRIEGVLTKPSAPTKIDRRLLESMPALKVVSTCSVGYDHIDAKVCKERNIALGNTPGLVDGATADVTWALILAAGRRLLELHRFCTTRTSASSKPSFFGKEVYGSTLGIVGMGRVGLAVARRALGFDMKLIYHNRRRRDAATEEQFKAEYVSDLKELMSRSDYIVNCLPASAETYRLFGTTVFAAAKQDAVFVNVGRGSSVDHDALVESLKSGRLLSAGLDVTDPEPLPRDHPLLNMENVIIVPHVGTDTMATCVRIAEMALRNLQAGLDGVPLEASPLVSTT